MPGLSNPSLNIFRIHSALSNYSHLESFSSYSVVMGGRRQYLLVPHEALIVDTLLIIYLHCMRYVIDCFVDDILFNVGQSVDIMSLRIKKRKDGDHRCGDAAKFHFKVIPEFCYKIDVATAYLGSV